jgi:hypothetical protein
MAKIATLALIEHLTGRHARSFTDLMGEVQRVPQNDPAPSGGS